MKDINSQIKSIKLEDENGTLSFIENNKKIVSLINDKLDV